MADSEITAEAAQSLYAGFDPTDKARADELMKRMRGRDAVAHVLAQNTAFAKGKTEQDVAASSKPLSKIEKAGSIGLGYADAATGGLAPAALTILDIMHGGKGEMGERASSAMHDAAGLDDDGGGGVANGELADVNSKAHLGMEIANAAAAGGESAMSGARALPGAARTAGLRLKGMAAGAVDDLVEGGARPTVYSNTLKAVRAILGHGGEAPDAAIVESETLPTPQPPKLGPEHYTSAPADIPSLQRPAPRLNHLSDLSDLPPDMPAAAPDPMLPLRPSPSLATGTAPVAAPPADYSDALNEAVTKMPLAPPPNAPMSAKNIKDIVRAAVAKGEPLKALAKRLKVPQGDIAAYYKGAQLGNL